MNEILLYDTLYAHTDIIHDIKTTRIVKLTNMISGTTAEITDIHDGTKIYVKLKDISKKITYMAVQNKTEFYRKHTQSKIKYMILTGDSPRQLQDITQSYLNEGFILNGPVVSTLDYSVNGAIIGKTFIQAMIKVDTEASKTAHPTK